MQSILELVTTFYPSHSKVERQSLAVEVKKNGMEYYADSWAMVERGDLINQKVQRNLVRTVYQLQFGIYEGGLQEILESLEDWTLGTLVFRELDENVNHFYQLIYTYIAWIGFAYYKQTRQEFLLGTRFLVLGFVLEFPIKEVIAKYFAKFCDIEGLIGDSVLFASAIRRNQASLGNRQEATVAKWVESFNTAGPKGSVNDFLTSHAQVDVLPESDLKILGAILDLYRSLVTNEIWQNISYNLCIHARTEGSIAAQRDPNKHYLHLLEQVDRDKISIWLQDYQKVAAWLAGKPQPVVNKMFKILSSKVNLKNEGQVDLLLKLGAELKEANFKGADEVIFYNEADNSFNWNKNLLG